MINEQYIEFINRSMDHPNTSNIYLNAIEELAKRIGEDPFSLSVDKLEKLYQRLLNGGDLHEFNISISNRAPSAAIKKLIIGLKMYLCFLVFLSLYFIIPVRLA